MRVTQVVLALPEEKHPVPHTREQRLEVTKILVQQVRITEPPLHLEQVLLPEAVEQLPEVAEPPLEAVEQLPGVAGLLHAVALIPDQVEAQPEVELPQEVAAPPHGRLTVSQAVLHPEVGEVAEVAVEAAAVEAGRFI